MFNLWLGLAASLVFIIYAGYRYLPNLLAVKGNTCYAKNNLEGAEKWYKRAISTGRADDKLVTAYALLQMRMGMPQEAERQLDAIIRKKSAKPEDKFAAKQYRCMAYCKQGRMDEAMADAKELFSESKTTLTYGIMGYFMHLSGASLDETLALCAEAYDYNCDDRDIVDNYLLALIRHGDYNRAAELSDSLIENHPAFVEAYYHGAMLQLKLGNKEKAREYLAKIPECRRTYMTTVSEEEISALAKEAE